MDPALIPSGGCLLAETSQELAIAQRVINGLLLIVRVMQSKFFQQQGSPSATLHLLASPLSDQELIVVGYWVLAYRDSRRFNVL